MRHSTTHNDQWHIRDAILTSVVSALLLMQASDTDIGPGDTDTGADTWYAYILALASM